MLDNFVFGVATSAYQIEGGWDADGKVPSIWDEMSHTPGHVQNGHTGDIACDHYHRWKKDVHLMADLSIQAYRFSISWSRIMPEPPKKVNEKGIKFYQKLVNKLLDYDIKPFVTLYHWDLPKWLDDIGGWGNPDIIKHFKGFASVMFEALPDVEHWITFNEPAVFVNNSWGHHNYPEAVRNVLLAHGKTASHYKANYDGKIGISLNLMPFIPNDWESKKDLLAVENVSKRHNGIWLEPIFNGRFPDGINKLYNLKNKLFFTKEEKNIVKTSIDFLGINYYSCPTVKYNPYKPPVNAMFVNNDYLKDEMGVGIKPHGLYLICKQVKEKYGDIPLYITENGCAYNDVLTHDNKVHDRRRINYMKQHLAYCNLTVEKGIPLKGYFHWSLMNNFEWSFGYTKQFGLIDIHYPTLKRTPKDSYYWYKKIIKDEEFRKKEMEEL